MFFKDKEKTEEVYQFYRRPDVDAEKLEKLPGGTYEVKVTNTPMGVMYGFTKRLPTQELVPITGEPFDTVRTHVLEMFSQKTMNLMKDLKYLNKDGIILYGEPGTGKTCFLDLLSRSLAVREQVITIYGADPADLREVTAVLRADDKDRPIMFVLEEFDQEFMRLGALSDLLNFLDGPYSEQNILIMATTNNIRKIPDNVLMRPSRFSMAIEIDVMPAEVLAYILSKKLPAEYHKQINITKLAKELEKVKATIDVAKTAALFMLRNNYDMESAIKLAGKADLRTALVKALEH